MQSRALAIRTIFESQLSSFDSELINELYFYYGGRIGTYIEYETNSLNDKMKQTIIKIVKENGGLVRTDNPKCDPIYVFIFNEEFDQYEDRKIIAIATCEDNDLSILFGPKHITLDGMTNDDILECDEWEPVMAGMVIANATLLDICEKLEEYIDYMLDVEDMDE